MMLQDLTETARDLCDPSSGAASHASPEYLRGVVELITHVVGLPMETGTKAVAEAIGLDWDELYPSVAEPVSLALHRNGGAR